MDDTRYPAGAAQLDTDDERRRGDDRDAIPERGSEPDPDLEAWLAARDDELEEQRFALADLDGRW